MKKGVDLFWTLKLFVMAQTALLTAVYSQNVTVLPGPVKVMQGHSVSLWCKIKYDAKKEGPVYWHSPPNFETRADDCHLYDEGKYAMSCSGEFFNFTIRNVEWADRGEYRCMYNTHESTVKLQVLVPVTDVKMKKIVTSTATEPEVEQTEIVCATNCAYPPPKISWFQDNEPFTIGSIKFTTMGCSGYEKGQKRANSTITLRRPGMDIEIEGFHILCTAENIDGESKISEAMAINIDEIDISLHQGVRLLVGIGVSILVVLLIVGMLFIVGIRWFNSAINKKKPQQNGILQNAPASSAAADPQNDAGVPMIEALKEDKGKDDSH